MKTMKLFSHSDASSYERTSVLSRDQLLKEAKASTAGTIVFLSHSSKDDPLVPGVVAFFRKFSAGVYADDFDKRLPNPPSTATAVILKNEIRRLPRFVVLATSNSYTSRWIPWELGLADGFRGIPPNAILPITPEGQIPTWLTTEYVHLYPKIVNINGAWYVSDPRGNAAWPLSDWLHTTIK